MQTTWKRVILTIVWSAQHPNANQNKQHKFALFLQLWQERLIIHHIQKKYTTYKLTIKINICVTCVQNSNFVTNIRYGVVVSILGCHSIEPNFRFSPRPGMHIFSSFFFFLFAGHHKLLRVEGFIHPFSKLSVIHVFLKIRF